jgi:hypothetical protein
MPLADAGGMERAGPERAAFEQPSSCEGLMVEKELRLSLS